MTRRSILLALYVGLVVGCAHTPEGVSCHDKCGREFPGEGWRWAIVLPVTPTPEYSVCVQMCKQGKTFRRGEAPPDG